MKYLTRKREVSKKNQTLAKQNSVDSTLSQSGSSDFSERDEIQMALLVTTCLGKMKNYSMDGSSRMGTPTFDQEVLIQCKYKELGLPDDGMPGARLQEIYTIRCPESMEALHIIQTTIGKKRIIF
jgi:hypothetical protein